MEREMIECKVKNKERFLSSKGVYILFIRVKNNENILVGKLGNIDFLQGLYVYIGSAQNNLEARIKRHLKKSKRIFWHIDYLLSHQCTKVLEVWIANGIKECEVAKKLCEEVSLSRGIRNFGSSDCKCLSHLFYLKNKKGKFRSLLKKLGFKKGILNEQNYREIKRSFRSPSSL
jgi:Uri superfamily endonuclease